MIPLALVTGFLGSGKTTFLQQLVKCQREQRLLYLVNEFGAVDVDGRLLELPPDELITIPGGSIFCRCLVSEFITNLQQIVRRGGAETIDGVVIEASGIANPKVIAQMLAETGLDADFALTRIIAIVDPDTLADLLETLPNIHAQIEAADVAIINKIDLHDAERVAATAQTLRRINPQLTIHEAVRCDVDVPLFAPGSGAPLAGEYALCADPNYARMAISPQAELTPAAIAAAVAPVQRALYRLKGFVRSDGVVQHLDVTPTTITLRPAAQTQDVGLVAIYPPTAAAQMQTLRTTLQGGGLPLAE